MRKLTQQPTHSNSRVPVRDLGVLPETSTPLVISSDDPHARTGKSRQNTFHFCNRPIRNHRRIHAPPRQQWKVRSPQKNQTGGTCKYSPKSNRAFWSLVLGHWSLQTSPCPIEVTAIPAPCSSLWRFAKVPPALACPASSGIHWSPPFPVPRSLSPAIRIRIRT